MVAKDYFHVPSLQITELDQSSFSIWKLCDCKCCLLHEDLDHLHYRRGPLLPQHRLPYQLSVSCLLCSRTFPLSWFPIQPTKRKRLRPRGREGMDWELGISRCKVLHTGRINNEAPLYSAGDCTQYPVINHNGKEYEKECMYVWLSHSAIRQKLIQHCKSTIL